MFGICGIIDKSAQIESSAAIVQHLDNAVAELTFSLPVNLRVAQCLQKKNRWKFF